MFRLDVLQNQWLIIALASGIIIMLGVVLTYLMMWRPRKETGDVITDLRSLFRLLPLVVIILFICIVIYQITYIVIFALNPPNL